MVYSIMQEFKHRDDWLAQVNEYLRQAGIDRQFIFPELKNYYSDYPNAYQASVKIRSEFHLGY